MSEVLPLDDWLSDGPAWIRLNYMQDLVLQPEDPYVLANLRQEIELDAAIKATLADLMTWPEPVLTNHKAAGHPLHKLVFLADIGLTQSDPGIGSLVDRILANPAPEGPLQVRVNIPRNFGGNGEDQLAWMLCDSPLVLYALARFGLVQHPSVQIAAAYLSGLVKEFGWPCAASPAVGKFRGPGRKDDPCPFATLVMLQALAQFPEYRESPATHTGAETLLKLWENRREQHPYLFKMGTDFCKLKAPLVWYDLLHVLNVLTQFPWVLDDPRLGEMAQILASKAGQDGRYTPESIWTTWKDWEFGQKKEPSRWVTLLASRILQKIQ
jgi:hypothetical protein